MWLVATESQLMKSVDHKRQDTAGEDAKDHGPFINVNVTNGDLAWRWRQKSNADGEETAH